MFEFFKKDPRSKLKKQYQALLKQALEAQRRGDIRLYSQLTAEAEQLAKKIDEL